MEIKFYQTTRGDYPVLEFIKNLPENHRKKILDKIDRLRRYGLQNSVCIGIVKKIKGKKYKGLYELIVNYDKNFYRIFFNIIRDNCWLIHVIKKKSNTTPPQALDKTINIKKQLENKYQ